MGLWTRFFAATYDRFMAVSERAGLSAHREALLARARGRVLEIGGGTGVNLRHYGSGVSELVIVEPEELMSRQLRRRLHHARVPTRVVSATAEQIPLQEASFDCAVATLVLCTVAHPAQALAELRRVLKPGGTLLFLEHVRSEDPAVARKQDRWRPVWSWFGCGCQCNRPTLDFIRAAGFEVLDLHRGALPEAPSIVRPLLVGVAVRS